MKTELEEAAEKYSENWEEITGLDYENTVPSEVNKLDFINGYKWKQEQNKNLYSEEDLREAFRQGEQNISYSETYGLDSKLTEQEWFEKFKKEIIMAQSSPEGITLGKGSQLVSMELSINKEKVLSIKQEKLYTEEDLLKFGAFVRIEDKKEKRLFLIQDYYKKWIEQYKKK